MREWSNKDTKYLRKHYSNTKNKTLALWLNRSKESIEAKAHMLSLKKTKAFLKKTQFKKGNPYRIQPGSNPTLLFKKKVSDIVMSPGRTPKEKIQALAKIL